MRAVTGRLERVAQAIHRAWARHVILIPADLDDTEAAWKRRWGELPERTRTEFMALAEAAIRAMD